MLTIIMLLLAPLAFAQEAPSLNLPTRTAEFQLDSLRGEVVYLDFWASWCKPCRDTFPWMNELHSTYDGRGLHVVAVNLDRKREAAEKFLGEHGAEFTIAFDPEGKSAEAYKVAAMPTAFLINRKGEIIHRHEGFHSKDRESLLELIEKTLSDTSVTGPSE